MTGSRSASEIAAAAVPGVVKVRRKPNVLEMLGNFVGRQAAKRLLRRTALSRIVREVPPGSSNPCRVRPSGATYARPEQGVNCVGEKAIALRDAPSGSRFALQQPGYLEMPLRRRNRLRSGLGDLTLTAAGLLLAFGDVLLAVLDHVSHELWLELGADKAPLNFSYATCASGAASAGGSRPICLATADACAFAAVWFATRVCAIVRRNFAGVLVQHKIAESRL